MVVDQIVEYYNYLSCVAINDIVVEHPPVEAYVNEVEAFSQEGCKKPPESFLIMYEEILNEEA